MQESKVRMSGRLVAVLIVVAALMLGLAGRLFYLQGMQYEYYLGKVLNNIQQESVIPAERGSIYDANGNLLATNLTTWRVFISPSDIQKYDGDARLISDRLAEILSVDAEEIYEKSQKANRKDETVKRHVEKAAADEVRAFIAENKDYKQMIHLEATNKRYYPCGQLACQVIGVMGTDRGLSGLELYYDEKMKGTDGVYRYARNGMSQSMPTKYETYIDAKDGYDIHTTLDVNIQRILEEQLKSTYEENKAEERVCGIVMDVKTGGILAMATYPTFDLNDPYTLVGEYAETFAAENLEAGSEEYNRRFWELVYTMWNNKAITDTYNPGSTFKIVTSAAALNEGVITPGQHVHLYRTVDRQHRHHQDRLRKDHGSRYREFHLYAPAVLQPDPDPNVDAAGEGYLLEIFCGFRLHRAYRYRSAGRSPRHQLSGVPLHDHRPCRKRLRTGLQDDAPSGDHRHFRGGRGRRAPEAASGGFHHR